MIIFLRKRDGTGQKAVTCYNYDYFNDNVHASSFEVFGIISSEYDGGFVIADDRKSGYKHVSLISTSTPNDIGEPHTTIKTDPLISIFDRQVVWLDEYVNKTYSYILEEIFDSEFGEGQADTLYRIDDLVELDVNGAGVASKEPDDVDDLKMFNLYSWLKNLEEKDEYYLMPVPTGDKIVVTDSVATDYSSNVIMGDSRFVLKSETFSSDKTAKISNHVFDDQDVDTVTTYYLKKDGTVETTEPALEDREIGIWKHVKDQTEADINHEFNSNKYEHKIKLVAKDWYKHYGEHVTYSSKDGRSFETIVTSVELNSDSPEMVSFELGNLPTTLLDELREEAEDNKSSSKSSKSSSGGSSPGGIKIDKLWENPSPTSGMTGYSILTSFGDKSKYNAFFATYSRNQDTSQYVFKNALTTQLYFSIGTDHVYIPLMDYDYEVSNANAGYRNYGETSSVLRVIDIASNNISVRNDSNLSSIDSKYEKYCIPLAIYGVKF